MTHRILVLIGLGFVGISLYLIVPIIFESYTNFLSYGKPRAEISEERGKEIIEKSKISIDKQMCPKYMDALKTNDSARLHILADYKHCAEK